MSRPLAPDEYPALSAGVCSILANLPPVPAKPGMLVGLADLTCYMPDAAEAEAAARPDGTGTAMLEFAFGRPPSRGTGTANTSAGWTPAMRAKAAEAQVRRGVRQRAEKAIREAEERGEEPPARAVKALADLAATPLSQSDDAKYRRELRARRKAEPRPTRAVCEHCKEEFKVGRKGWSRPKYCSRTCSRRAAEKRQSAERSAVRADAAPKECEHCKAPINAAAQRGRWRRFCSVSCSRKAARAKARAADPTRFPLICTEEGCEVRINEGVSVQGQWALRCDACRRKVKLAQQTARRAAAKKLREAQGEL